MPVNVRSSLEPYYRKDRKKWYPRGTFPIKTDEGKVERKRDYYGTGSDTRAKCQEDCDRLNRELEEAAKAGPLAPTFEEAVVTYLAAGGDVRFLGESEDGPRNRLLDHLGQYRCDEIDDAVMGKAATTLYPTATAATLNRQLHTPVISVLRLASNGKNWKPDIQRPKGYSKLRPAKSPPDDWFDSVFAVAGKPLQALLLMCTLHRIRAGEAIRLLPSDFDPETGTVILEKTKTGEPVFLQLAKSVVEAIKAYGWEKGPGLFGTLTPKNRRGVYRQLKTACRRAGVDYFTPHKAGSHAFAKRLLRAGKSLAHVKAAGRWKTIRVPAELYGHLEHSEVAAEATRIGEEALQPRKPKADVIRPPQFDKQRAAGR
jgi:integrase